MIASRVADPEPDPDLFGWILSVPVLSYRLLNPNPDPVG